MFKYGLHVFKDVEIDVIFASARYLSGPWNSGNEHPTGNLGSAFIFLSFRPYG